MQNIRQLFINTDIFVKNYLISKYLLFICLFILLEK